LRKVTNEWRQVYQRSKSHLFTADLAEQLQDFGREKPWAAPLRVKPNGYAVNALDPGDFLIIIIATMRYLRHFGLVIVSPF
jgi:hypothetical protein